MIKTWTPWTIEAETQLIQHYTDLGARRCAALLGKTRSAVYKRAKALGLTHTQRVSHPHISGHFWNNVIHGAKARKLSVAITRDDIWQRYLEQGGRCALTGWEIRFDRRVGETTASVDRIDSSKHYTLDNIQIVHKAVNVAKMNLSDTAFYSMCKTVHEHRSRDLEHDELEWVLDTWNDTEHPERRRVLGALMT